MNFYYMTTQTGRTTSKSMTQEETMDMTCMVQVLLEERQRHEEEMREERVRRDEERAKGEEETQQ